MVQRLQTLNLRIGQAVAWLTLFMVIVTFVIVVLRYGFNLGWIALQESVTYMHACVLMLGMGYTLQQGNHVRVDIFYHRLSQRRQAMIDIAGTLVLLIPTCLLLIWANWDYVINAWQIFESSRQAGGLPLVFLLKSLLLLMPLLLLLQGLSDCISRLPLIRASV